MTAVPSPAAEDVVTVRRADMKAMAAAAKTMSGIDADSLQCAPCSEAADAGLRIDREYLRPR